MNAVVSVVLFDQNLDQKIDLGWPGLPWGKPWAGPGQALGWAKVKPWAGPWENWLENGRKMDVKSGVCTYV